MEGWPDDLKNFYFAIEQNKRLICIRMRRKYHALSETDAEILVDKTCDDTIKKSLEGEVRNAEAYFRMKLRYNTLDHLRKRF